MGLVYTLDHASTGIRTGLSVEIKVSKYNTNRSQEHDSGGKYTNNMMLSLKCSSSIKLQVINLAFIAK